MKPLFADVVRSNADDRSWSDKFAEPDDDRERLPLQPLVMDLLDEEEHGIDADEHHEKHQVHRVAERTLRAIVRDAIPASAMLYIPADEIAAMTHRLRAVAHHILDDAHAASKIFGEDGGFCHETLERELKQRLRHHLIGEPFIKRHNPQHHHASWTNRSAPETGIGAVATIASEHGGIVDPHGLVQSDHGIFA